VDTVTLDMSPAALYPYYDEDTKLPLLVCVLLTINSIIFLWSKGSRRIRAYHITSTPPSLTVLPSFESPDLQMAVTFLPKMLVDVRKVEILQGLKFTSSNKVERFGFSIPRNKVSLCSATLNVRLRVSKTIFSCQRVILERR
jgi:coronin-7